MQTLVDGLQIYCQKHNLIEINQVGFKKNPRTSDHLLTLKTVVKKYVTVEKKKLLTFIVDFKKAEDLIWPVG